MSSAGLVRSYEGIQLAEDYEKYRPSYPPCIKKVILDFLRSQGAVESPESKFQQMLDVGCGGGKSTRMFAPYFDSVVGIDISAGQIEMAKKMNKEANVSFQLVHDHLFPIEDESVDLVTCATAAHYLNIEVFVKECERVLKPGGCVVIYIYYPYLMKPPYSSDDVEDEDLSSKFLDFQFSFFEKCKMKPEIANMIREKYQPIYKKINQKSKRWVKCPKIEKRFTLSELRSFYATIGKYHAMGDIARKNDPLEEFMVNIKKLVGLERVEDNAIHLNLLFEYPMIAFTKQASYVIR